MDLLSRRAIELLLKEAYALYRENRFAEALRAAERAVEGARKLGDIGLEIKAVDERAAMLSVLGDKAAALRDCTWILGVAEDPSRRAELESAGVEWQIASAYRRWADAASFLPEIPTERLLGVLDAGEAYVRGIGRPGWRAGFLYMRAWVFKDLGRIDEAIGVAEEGLALKLRDGSGPGYTLATHRRQLGDLLRQANRHEEAAACYRAVLDDPVSAQYDRVAALGGLARCALAANDALDARKHAEEALRLGEGMGDGPLATVLAALIEACRSTGDRPAARTAAERRLEGARRLGSKVRLYFALRSAADVALDEQDAAKARALLDEAQPLAEALDRQRGGTGFQNEIAKYCRRLSAFG